MTVSRRRRYSCGRLPRRLYLGGQQRAGGIYCSEEAAVEAAVEAAKAPDAPEPFDDPRAAPTRPPLLVVLFLAAVARLVCVSPYASLVSYPASRSALK